jgi:hypothetical protein
VIVKDDRTEEQRRTHRELVVMTDRCLSGWGDARGGTSVAAWACAGVEDRRKAERWVRERTDALRVRIVYDGPRRYRPRNAAHFHVYVVTEGHPALDA